MDGFQSGRRVHYWRTRRRLTQPEFAAQLGKSGRWVEDLEGGRRQADPQLSVLRLAALRLGITLGGCWTTTRWPQPTASWRRCDRVHAMASSPEPATTPPRNRSPSTPCAAPWSTPAPDSRPGTRATRRRDSPPAGRRDPRGRTAPRRRPTGRLPTAVPQPEADRGRRHQWGDSQLARSRPPGRVAAEARATPSSWPARHATSAPRWPRRPGRGRRGDLNAAADHLQGDFSSAARTD